MTKHVATPEKSITADMVVPKYVTRFHCTGSDCPDSCCAGWAISIDKSTFQDYRRIVHPAIKPLIQQHMLQVDKESYAKHAKISLRASDGHCGMHSKEGLCLIQQNLGEDALSDTCFTYPRSVALFGDNLEQNLTLSCPEAARLALTASDAFEFVVETFTARRASTPVIEPARGFSLAAMDNVRLFAIQLFQTENLSNTERLATIGWACRQFDDLVTSGRQSQSDQVLTELRAMVEDGDVHAVVKQLKKQQSTGATLFSILFGTKPASGTTPRHAAVLDRVRKGLGMEMNDTPDGQNLAERYARGLELLASDGGRVEAMVSRYLLNDVLRETFPWGQPTSMSHYRRLLTRYGILRLMLVGVAVANGTCLDEETIIQVVQVFCRLYQHDSGFAKQAERLLVQSGWTELEQLYALLH